MPWEFILHLQINEMACGKYQGDFTKFQVMLGASVIESVKYLLVDRFGKKASL
jgi:hypothetical protein